MRYLESKDVAARAGLTPNAIRLAVARGELKPSANTGRGALFTEETVEQWIRSREEQKRHGR